VGFSLLVRRSLRARDPARSGFLLLPFKALFGTVLVGIYGFYGLSGVARIEFNNQS